MACSEATAKVLPAFLLAACVGFNAFEVEPSSEERSLTAKNLDRVAALDRARPSAAERPLTFALLSDTHDAYDAFRGIVNAINARPEIELVLHAGDFTDFGTQQEYHWAYDCFSKLYAPFIAAPGNHDGLTEGKKLYSLVFGPDDFAFDYAGVRFLVFNTNTLEWDVEEPDFAFLESETRGSDAPKFLLTHQPPYSEPHLTLAASERFATLLAPITAYLYGHVHEEFTRERVGGTEFVKTASARDGSWTLITTRGSSLEVSACRFDACDVETVRDISPGAPPLEEGGGG